mgnify:CR=1 FL=1
MTFMRRLYLILFVNFCFLRATSQALTNPTQLEQVQLFVSLCGNIEKPNGYLSFLIKIKNQSSETIEIPKLLVPSLLDDADGNILYEIKYLSIAGDTITNVFSHPTDKAIRPTEFIKKIRVESGDEYLKQTAISNLYFEKKGSYLIRFRIPMSYWIPGKSEIISNWYKFEL